MLLLPALLFFMLSISVVASPVSPMTSDISRGNGESEGQAPSGQHGQDTTDHHDGNTQLEKPEKLDLDGIWRTISYKSSIKPITFYMKVIHGTVLGIWPMRQKAAAEVLFKNQDWYRERDLNVLHIVAGKFTRDGMCQGFESTTFHGGLLTTESIVYAGEGSESRPVSIPAKFGSSVAVNLKIQPDLWVKKRASAQSSRKT